MRFEEALDEMDLVDYSAVQSCFRDMLDAEETLWQGAALLARWFRFQPSEIDALEVEEFLQ